MNEAEHYSYRVRWSGEDASYVGTVAELPSLSWLAEDRGEAFAGIQRLAAEVVADMSSAGEPVPVALGDRSFSGKFMVRVPAEVHRRLSIEAAEQNVSLNRLISARLAG
jgi:predicted HicB family RNase H-like nuclease